MDSKLLNVQNWKKFKIRDVFPILIKGKCSDSTNLTKGKDVPYIGAKKSENGVMEWCKYDKNLVSAANCISFICQGAGSNGFCNYFDIETIQTTSNILGYNKNLNEYNGLFIVTISDLERPKWSFGRGRAPKLAETTIKLPADANGDPDWKYMEEYIKKLRCEEKENYELSKPLIIKDKKLDTKNWKKFRLEEIFVISGSKTTSPDTINEDKELIYNYVTTQNINNGVEKKSDIFTELGNCITIDSATIGAVFYQEKNFIASDHVEIIRNKNLNQYIGIFIVSLLKQEQFRYGYGRKWNQTKIRNTTIKLPADANGDPDWKYMEEYIKTLPYSKYL